MREELKTAMGEWLGGLAPWDVFSTWTFSRPVNVQGAMYMARRHLRWVEKAAGVPIYGFVGVEKGERGGLLHLHALLGNVARLKPYCGTRLAPGEWGGRLNSAWVRSQPEKFSALGIPMRCRWVREKKTDRQCCMVHAWPCGIARVLPYNPKLGASYYVSKYVTKQLGEWELFGFPAVPQLPLVKN